MLEKFIKFANAGLSRKELEYFYPLKEKLLKRFGKLDGYDWQYVEKICFACDGTGEPDTYYKEWEDWCEHCHGSGYWRRFWTKLERRKIGSIVFHTPVKKFQSQPDEPFEITINGYVNHAPVSHRKALWAFFALAIIFDIGALISFASSYLPSLRFADIFILKRRGSTLTDSPF